MQRIGVLRAVGDGQTIVFVQDLLILPEYQRRGVGTALLRALLAENRDKRLMIIGGDTLLGFMTAIHCTELMPQRELADGMVLSALEKDGGTYQVITKSGGFGSDKLLLTL